ncbi:peptidyl-prolyl cis-trans isomerase 6-like [Frankliniella occidentalis]|uniref:Peptidyl-prolyl cis-trans isomerase n=1 Tax=Frankliniella occidentalis TaxID=133901 RepID=A0A9C6X557_FRAOC|nr:peptidyl-prolyl cis-trans isomerase 6-like [Frankliniella occidentalis]
MARVLCALALCVALAHAAEVRVTDQVFFDISIGGEDAGRIVFGLFGEVAPRTVRNFVTLASEGIGGRTYAGTPFHRVIRKFMVQGELFSGSETGYFSRVVHFFIFFPGELCIASVRAAAQLFGHPSFSFGPLMVRIDPPPRRSPARVSPAVPRRSALRAPRGLS